MGNFKFSQTNIQGLYVIEQEIFKDNRGYFMESYNNRDFKEAGIFKGFVQENISVSKKGVIRGLHFQKKFPQEKLVRVITGEVFDVAVDLRKTSKTFGEWYSCILSEENKRQFYIPKGFAHGFLVLSDKAKLVYKCTEFYHPEDEAGIIWNDKDIGIKWPLDKIDSRIQSEKDRNWPEFKDYLLEIKKKDKENKTC